MLKKKVLILNGQYLPGYKGGGPIRSCVNMVENLSDEFEFYILCADRDFKDCDPYEGIKVDQWNDVGSAKVFYMSPKHQTLKGFKEILNKTDYDILYLNGFFSPIFTIKPLLLLKLGQIKKSKVILTPRGDFTGGCENKKIKKYTYIFISKLIGLYKNLIWHATSELEMKDIEKLYPSANIITVSNLSDRLEKYEVMKEKEVGSIKLVFISRISRKKNLSKTIELLSKFKGSYQINYDIYGPLEDEAYWNECQAMINKVPSNIKIEYKGEIPHYKVKSILKEYHCLFFPTMGENYGHIIAEALSSGCMLLISNTTPWVNLEKYGIGWDIELDNSNQYLDALEYLCTLNKDVFNKHANNAIEYIYHKANNNSITEVYRDMFNY